MRLDHLLSKELHRTSRVGVGGRGLMLRRLARSAGWGASPVPGIGSWTSPSFVGGGGCGSGGVGKRVGLLEKMWKHRHRGVGHAARVVVSRVGTLLGPEGTTVPRVAGSGRRGGGGGVSSGRSVARRARWVRAGGGSVWSLRIAQWTRASFVSVGDFAFFLVMLAGVLVKLSRAHGGCLGIRSR